jgi:hypothetical protein
MIPLTNDLMKVLLRAHHHFLSSEDDDAFYQSAQYFVRIEAGPNPYGEFYVVYIDGVIEFQIQFSFMEEYARIKEEAKEK